MQRSQLGDRLFLFSGQTAPLMSLISVAIGGLWSYHEGKMKRTLSLLVSR
jgi:hypothetical protein